MRASAALVLCGLMLEGGFAAPPDSRLVLASRNSPPAYSIVVGANASACVRYAAQELQRYVLGQTGVRLPIADDRSVCPERAVLLGNTRHTGDLLGWGKGSANGPDPVSELGDEGFRLKVVGSRLLILGGEGRGPLYGVYELLERFGGCAWYAPSWDVVPRLDLLSMPSNLDETQRPAFDLRSINWNGFGRELAFAARNKLNLETFGPELGGSRFRFDPVLGKCHTFNRLLPPDRWFKDHPEYFSEIGGVRRSVNTQLCLTNPDVLRICTDELLKRIAVSYPQGIRRFGVSPNDWRNNCRCARCAEVDRRAKSPSGSLIAFVNAIAEQIEKVYPDVLIQTLAYSYTRRPPVGIAPRSNVQVCICTMECDFFRSLTESRAIENRHMRQDFAGWASAGTPLSVWDYGTDFACYYHPWPNYDALRGNLNFYAERGVSEVFMLGNGCGRDDLWGNVRNWLLAKWMWNPRLDEQELLRRCFRDLFGPAAQDMRAAFDAVRTAPRDTKRFPMGCFESIYSEGIDDVSLVVAARHMERAAETVKGTPYEETVRLARLPIDFTRAIRGAARPVLSRRGAVVEEQWEDERAGARRIRELMDRPEGLRFCDDTAGNAVFSARIRSLAEQEGPSDSVRRLVLEEKHLTGSYPATVFRHVDDPTAGDGRAVLLPGARESCVAWLDLRSLVWDPDGLYMPRIRVRTNAGQGHGVPFRAGVFSRRWNREVNHFSLEHGESTERYRWYSLGAFSPHRGDYLWIGLGHPRCPGQPAPDVWIDRVEFVRLD